MKKVRLTSKQWNPYKDQAYTEECQKEEKILNLCRFSKTWVKWPIHQIVPKRNQTLCIFNLNPR